MRLTTFSLRFAIPGAILGTLLGACSSSSKEPPEKKSTSPAAMANESSQGPAFSWGFETQETPKMQAVLTRESSAFRITLHFTENGKCRSFSQLLSGDLPRVQDETSKTWAIVQPRGTPTDCKPQGDAILKIPQGEWKEILAGENAYLSARDAYVLAPEEFQSSKVPLVANMGTRSLLAIGTDGERFAEAEIAALVNVTATRFEGVAVHAKWLDDKQTQSFSSPLASQLKFRPIQMDAEDAVYASWRCRLLTQYRGPLSRQQTADRKQGKSTSKALGDELLQAVLEKIEQPTEECP